MDSQTRQRTAVATCLKMDMKKRIRKARILF